MKKQLISAGWYLSSPGFSGTVDLPNDYAVIQKRDINTPGGASTGFYKGGVGTYTKYIDLPSDGTHVLLDVDGAYMCAHVFFNETLLTMHPYGYTPFLVDLTDYIIPEIKNKLEIRTNDMQPSSRWYSGAGIYRDVFVWTGGSHRIAPWDLFVTTPTADGKVNAAVRVTADFDAEAVIRFTVRDAEGRGIYVLRENVVLVSGINPLEFVLNVPSPHLWDVDDPYLYTLDAEISVNGEVTDTHTQTFGIRTVSVDRQNGFILNGRPMKLRGGCIHHDHGGALGAMAYPAAEERKVSLLKKAGFNALRTAHNPPSLAFLEVCDRLGMLVMDEAFDMWAKQKNNLDYHLWFFDHWQRDIAAMVMRDRAHPCVVSYSVGNEVPESNGVGQGVKWSRLLCDEVRRYDNTRPVSVSTYQTKVWAGGEESYKADFMQKYMCENDPDQFDSWTKRTAELFAPADIAGYNYIFRRYKTDGELFPERIIWGSETHALDFYDSWHTVLECSHVLGDFTWTAYDNMGEAGTGRSMWARDGVIKGISLAEYPWRNCYQGDLDLCGYRRPQSYFREAVWLGMSELKIYTTHPEHYGEEFSGTKWHWYDVLDSWTFGDEYLGKPVRCEVYTDADNVEWYLHGRKVAESVPVKCIAYADIPYEKGMLSAVAYKNGEVVGRAALETAGSPAKLRAYAEKSEIKADKRDLCYVWAEVLDDKGRRIPDSKAEIRCTVTGGRLIGLWSGDPKSEDDFTSGVCHAFEGRVLAVVSADAPGRVCVKFEADGLRWTAECVAASE